ncbi:DUF4906 domain-containing protein [uncultured Parabacteroides sp.]|uniref:DUF4906 domain-containing protein n=1 Tax=uncultured Parabacteroides sp. TaxID=512312 RepID=UPI002585B46D|nr:DUF4906 domain-containing protein [uncultured Parabacteroides sp.]
MKRYNNYIASIGFFIVALLVTSCSDEEDIEQTSLEMNARLNLTISTRATADDLIKGGDGKFSSLALYIFNKTDGKCEYSELIPVITPQYVDELTRSIQVSPQDKIIYAIGNYNDEGKEYSIIPDESKPLSELDTMTITNKNEFTDTSLLMVGRQVVEIDGLVTEATIQMERLVSRLDVYMFKSRRLESKEVIVKSIELVNQIINTRGEYQNTIMVSPVKTKNDLRVIDSNNVLGIIPEDLSGITPDNATESFYSYQNIAASATPDSTVTPYLLITADIDGETHRYKGYITDGGQTSDKYSLKRNTVYRIMAMLDNPDNMLILKTTTLPWTKSTSQIGHVVNEGDYSFGANNTEATTGIVQYPYVLNGESQNNTSYASYSFQLTAPAGAIWTATLTNGLEFTFGTEGSTNGKLAISKGIAGNNTYEIKVGASRPWNSTIRKAYLYITVEGKKLNINPVQSNGQRALPGDNDTDVLITQTEYK